MELKPSREAFCKLAAETNLIAVAKEINMDLDTPVSVYYKLVGEKKGFILESVDTTHQQFGRFSFIGAEPFARLQVFKDKLMINENGLMKCIMASRSRPSRPTCRAIGLPSRMPHCRWRMAAWSAISTTTSSRPSTACAAWSSARRNSLVSS